MANPNPVHKFEKGESGNPNGRPKREWTMTGLYEAALEEQHETGKSYKEIIAKKLIALASTGDLVAIKEIGNRIDGMPIQKNILAGDEDAPLKIDISETLRKVYGPKREETT